MTVRVAVVDPLPMYAKGLAATLGDHGFPADTPADLAAWVRQDGTPVVLLTVAGAADWRTAEIVLGAARVVVVADRADLETWHRAVAAGAVGVLARDADTAEVVATVRAAVAGRSLVPSGVLRALTAGGPAAGPDRPVSDDEIRWLRQLAEGTTVARLAATVGYSERMMFRLLADLYARLGADNRTRALIRARDEGWL